jgi:hypothetical protein
MPLTIGTPLTIADDPPITYTEQALASGTLGGHTFTNALVTLTMVGNTGTVSGGSGFFTNTTGTFTLNVAGIGTGTFTDSMEVFDNQTFSPAAAGFGDITAGGSVLDTFNSAFATYDLTTSIGPTSGTRFINPGLGFNTTLGVFIISSAGDSTFTASTVPEPSSIFLLGTGLMGLMAMRRSRNKHRS